jgi:sialic acid synthase SpsE
VKFQTFDPERLAAPGAATAEYQRAGRGDALDQRALLAPLALPRTAWTELKSHAGQRGIAFLSSPFDEASADLLDDLGVPAFKVASGELTNDPFLQYLARKGRPLLVSTGMADMREVADALDVIREAGDVPVALFHCVSSYPARAADANLKAMGSLRAAFHRQTGWSDHSPGIELPVAAVALGASLIEKHLTLDRTMPGPDHMASLDPAAFGPMVVAIRSVESALGSGLKSPTASEAETALVARRSLHWAGDLDRGTTIGASDLDVLRPGTGMAPARMAGLVGGRTSRSVRAGTAIVPDDIE